MSIVNKYKWPIISVFVIVAVLMIMITVGFAIGILSEDPDGLERVLIDENGEAWLESLKSPWKPILSWITNDYGAGIIGLLISITVIILVFYLIIHYKKRTSS